MKTAFVIAGLLVGTFLGGGASLGGWLARLLRRAPLKRRTDPTADAGAWSDLLSRGDWKTYSGSPMGVAPKAAAPSPTHLALHKHAGPFYRLRGGLVMNRVSLLSGRTMRG